MSKGKEIEGEDERGTDACTNNLNASRKWVSKRKEIEGEDDKGDLCRNDLYPNKKGLLVRDAGNSFWITSNIPPPRNINVCETNRREGPSCHRFSSSEGRVGGSSKVEPQDADYSYVPTLNYEVVNLILARVPRSEYWKLPFVDKRISSLLKSGELFKIRKDIGVRESSVFIFATGDKSWWAFDRQFSSRRKLPDLPADCCFSFGDKESLCAGTHLLISGREINGVVVWRYELETNGWRKGPSMINPRCLFASASSGTVAFVAGGVTGTGVEVLNSAEKYNPETRSWEALPRMQQARKLCSGCYMDNKFYVIGGINEKGKGLTCAEAYDENKRAWEPIPDMLENPPVATFQSPPLIAVVNNELYSLESSSNQLKMYMKASKTWKKLGPVPVRADSNKGWGVAFKSLGNELLVIGASTSTVSYSGDGMAIYTCCPDSEAEELQWRPLECSRNRLSNFILNCSVMVA